MNTDVTLLSAIQSTLSLIRKDTLAISTTAAGTDYELRATTYKANKPGTGYTTGDFIQRTDIINAVTGVVSATVWFNETAATVIAAPPIADLDAYTPPSTITLGAGSSIVGKVGIDQTTPGTTNLVQTKETPDATSAFSITPYSSAALEASHIIKASAGNLFGFIFSNTNAALRYVQVFNSTTVPVDGTVPVLTFPVQANSVFAFDTGKFANYFTTGISVCNSTTLATKTIGAADSLFYVQYI